MINEYKITTTSMILMWCGETTFIDSRTYLEHSVHLGFWARCRSCSEGHRPEVVERMPVVVGHRPAVGWAETNFEDCLVVDTKLGFVGHPMVVDWHQMVWVHQDSSLPAKGHNAYG